MKKTYWEINRLHEWEHNPRTITRENFERLKNQIKELGEYKPLIITKDGTVLGGNMRLKAYRELGYEKVWVSIVEANTEEKKIKYALSDNDQLGEYQKDDLANLVGSFPDLDLSNFTIQLDKPTSLGELIDEFKEVVEDEVPEVEEGEPKSKQGEIYQLGRHRLMCGDATKKEDVKKLMDGKKADMVFTDPPYNVNYSGKNEFLNKYDKGNIIQTPIKNDKINNYKKFSEDWLLCLSNFLKEKNAIYITFAGNSIIDLLNSFMGCNYYLSQILVWVKNNIVLGRLDYYPKHELIVYGWLGKHNFYGKNEQSVWEIDKPPKSDLHPTMKPVELIVKAILNSSKKDDIVLDLFGGSGSTLIACEQTNRICYMMEIDPYYCDVIRKRYANFIGKKDQWETITPKI